MLHSCQQQLYINCFFREYDLDSDYTEEENEKSKIENNSLCYRKRAWCRKNSVENLLIENEDQKKKDILKNMNLESVQDLHEIFQTSFNYPTRGKKIFFFKTIQSSLVDDTSFFNDPTKRQQRHVENDTLKRKHLGLLGKATSYKNVKQMRDQKQEVVQLNDEYGCNEENDVKVQIVGKQFLKRSVTRVSKA